MKKYKIIAIIIGIISIVFLFSTFDFGGGVVMEETLSNDDMSLEENYISQELSSDELSFSSEENYNVSNTIDSFTNLIKQISSLITAVLSILVATGILPKKKKEK